MEFNKVNDGLTASGQITLDEIAVVAEHGFTTLIDNRPDEEIGPEWQSDAMAKAAEAAGLTFHYLPVYPGQFTPDLIAETKRVFAEAEGPVFAYCRSGTRSTTVWALSQAGEKPAEEIIKDAAGAGYDLSPLADYLTGA